MSDLCVDCSNYSSAFGPEAVACWQEAGVTRAIVQAVDPPVQYPVTQTHTQLRVCASAELRTDAYVYLQFGLGLDDITEKLSLLEGFEIGRIWLDVEDDASILSGPSHVAAVIQAALNEIACFPALQSPGIYTGKWWWDRYLYPAGQFSEMFSVLGYPLWASVYDDTPDPTVWTPFGGWDKLTIKQYIGSTQLCGVTGIDMNVLAQEATQPMAIVVGPGMAAQMAQAGDAPLCGHKQYTEVDDEGQTYNVEEVYGAKGLYLSSNAGGEWRNAGPF